MSTAASLDMPRTTKGVPVAAIGQVAKRWRGVLHPATGDLVDPLPPGTPDRTALLVATMAGRVFGDTGTGDILAL